MTRQIEGLDLAGALHEVRDALRETARRCRETTTQVAPRVRYDQSTCERYAAALVNWPIRPPSYEKIGLLLSQLNRLEQSIDTAILEVESTAELAARLQADPDAQAREDEC